MELASFRHGGILQASMCVVVTPRKNLSVSNFWNERIKNNLFGNTPKLTMSTEILITDIRGFHSLENAIRSGNACIAITELKGGDACIPDNYFGSLVVEGDRVELRLRSHSKEASKIHFRDFGEMRRSLPQFRKLECVLDGHLKVIVRNVTSIPQEICSSSGAFHRYSLGEISLPEFGNRDQEAMQIRMISKISRSTLKFENLALMTKEWCSLRGEVRASWPSDGLGGAFAPYLYQIRQEGDDLAIEVTLQKEQKSLSAEADLNFLSALILTFVWINGGHPYTYAHTHQRDDDLIGAFVQPLKRTPNCKARLISGGPHEDAAGEVLDCGIRFFQTDSPLVVDLRMLIWEYRYATIEDSITLGMLLQACSLLEGLIGLVLRYPMGLSKSKIDKLTADVQSSSDTRKGHAEARFLHAGDHLEFDWNSQLRPVFLTWKKARNALAHGDIQGFFISSDSSVLSSYRQVIQAFNAVALRLIGYKGAVKMDGSWHAISDLD